MLIDPLAMVMQIKETGNLYGALGSLLMYGYEKNPAIRLAIS